MMEDGRSSVRAVAAGLAPMKQAYDALIRTETPPDLLRIVERIDDPAARRRPRAKLALVAEADGERRALAKALLEETELAVLECASAEAALAILTQEANSTVFLLADRVLAGERDGDALADAVKTLWPAIHVAVANQRDDGVRMRDAGGIARLSRPWRGLDVLMEADHALARAA